jgi:serine/threonine-protein kinase
MRHQDESVQIIPAPIIEVASTEIPCSNVTGSMSASVNPGDVLADKYRVERVLAMGGMGVVVAAHHLQLDEQVAIKFLRDETLSDPEAVARFAREARAAIKIKSEHVTRVIDVGALANGAPYMVMEYLEGETLAAFLRLRGALPLGQAVEFMLHTCEAIAEAHALGIVHRDIKPANLFVTRRADGLMAIKVLDFGISKLATNGAPWSSELTRKSVALGSPSYMSPEQLACASAVDARTDIWSLGVTFFEMLTGEVPFHADTTPQLCGMILRDPAPPARELRPNTPDGVEAILRKCLEKERENRYENVGELAVALAAFGPQRARASAQRIWRTVHAPSAEATADLSLALDESSGVGADRRGDQTRVVWDHSAGAFAPKRRLAAWGAAGALAMAAVLALAMGPLLRQRAASADNARVREITSGGPALHEASLTPPPIIEVPEPGPTLRSSPAPAVDSVGSALREKAQPPAPPATVSPPSKRSRRGTTEGAAPVTLSSPAPPISTLKPGTSSPPLRKTPASVYDERN